MRITAISAVMVLSVWLVGCAKQDAGTAPADQPLGGSTSKAAPAAPAAPQGSGTKDAGSGTK